MTGANPEPEAPGMLPRLSHRPGIRTAATLLALASCSIGNACRAPEPTAPSPPGAKNVILLTLDGMRQDHVSFFGYPRQTTPNLDTLAEQGLAFPTIVPSGCSTKASLTSLFTSMDYSRHKLIDHGAVLDGDFVTLAESFHAQGYETAGYVATPHLSASMDFDQGFDHYRDFTSSDEDYIRADMIITAMLEDLRGRLAESGRPFFVYAHLEEPHPPWRHGSPWLEDDEPSERFFDRGCTFVPAPEELSSVDERKKRNLIAKYDGAARYADDWLGVLLATLRSLDLMKDTVIAVSTDHGIELLDRYSGTHGYNPFDEVVRGFLVVYDGRDQLPALDTDAIQGRIFDVGPTLLSLAGLPIHPSLQGIDLIHDAESLPPLAFVKCYNAEVVRSLNYKLIALDFSEEGRNPPPGMREEMLLFDLRNDPGETVNVRDELPDVFAALQQGLNAYREEHSRGFTPATPLPDEVIDPETLERLKSLGYVE